MNTIQTIQSAALDAYRLLGELASVSTDANVESREKEHFRRKLETAAAIYERGVIELREYCERYYAGLRDTDSRIGGSKAPLPTLSITGKASVNEYGWLHITLNTLLPHCRYTTPLYLTDTITRLLDEYEARGKPLPRFDEATLIIDEHCDISSRAVYDQDNKGWKAIPNALKGRVIPDDDQFTLHVCLLSTRNPTLACHIWLIPRRDAGDFFGLKSENIPIPP
jgi:hypothetical protein